MNGELRRLYREQYDMYLPLSQEEVEELYASEGIQDKPIAQMVKELEDEIGLLKSQQIHAIKSTREETYESYRKQYREITSQIGSLEEKRRELLRIQRELEDVMAGIGKPEGVQSSLVLIDEEIERLRAEWSKLNEAWGKLDEEKLKIHREYEERIDALEEKLSTIRVDYAAVFNQLYSSSRGIVRKNRKFPSIELRDKIVLGYLGLAKGLAGKYFRLCDKSIEYDDLVQTAYEALMSAAHYYVPSPRATFKTYATRCIENKLKHSIGESKKRRRNRPTKPLEFIDEELRRLDYITMFIDANRCVTGRNGEKCFSNYFQLKPVGVQYKFKRSLRDYNRERRSLGEDKKQLPSFKVKKRESGFQEILSGATRYLKESKLKVLISDSDMEMASLVVSTESCRGDLREIYELLYILKLYQSRLESVRILLSSEMELALANDGIVPSNEELLEDINRKIAIENKGIYRAKHSDNRVFYKRLDNYNAIYYDLWRVDFFANRTSSESRASERDKLGEDFKYMSEDTVYHYRSLIEDIMDSEEDIVCLYSHSDDEECASFLVTWDTDCWDFGEEKVFTKSEATEFLRCRIEEIESLTVEEYVLKALEWRKQKTLEELKRINDSIVRDNRDIEDMVRQQSATRYVRYWTPDDVRDASNWLTLLYESGLSFGYSSQSKIAKTSLSVEDEAFGNMFMDDYLKALDCLTPLAREILLMYYDENGVHSFKAKEIAERLGIKERDVYREKDKALKILKKSDVLKNYLE